MPVPSADQIFAALWHPNSKWVTPTITFSIPVIGSSWPGYNSEAYQSTADYGVLNAVQAGNFRLATDAWARLIAVPVMETSDLANPGEIRVAFSTISTGAVGQYAPPVNQELHPTWGDIWLDRNTFGNTTLSPNDNSPSGFGSAAYFVLLHELGHTLGLKHPHEGDATLPLPWANARYSLIAYDGLHDSTIFSFSQGATQILRDFYFVKIATPMVFDVLAIQRLYGSNTTDVRDTIYSWSGTKNYLDTIYDAGGVDSIDLTEHTRSSIVDLTPGAYSSIDYWPIEQQKAHWLSVLPSAAHLISLSFDDPQAKTYTYTWHDNLGIAYGTIIENVSGGSGDDTITGNEANNRLSGNDGADRIFGGMGNDTLTGGEGQSYLRGDEGNDSISGGDQFDDINGNMGNDTVNGGAGDDYAVGGKDNDSLTGDAGVDIVWGNLGDDTCSGGDGADQVRGGQGNDSVAGGAGDDFVSGDRGDDTITGGLGADLFHTSQDAGVDRVLDFSLAEGDRVFLDLGTTYTTSQVGADTIIDMGSGNQMILVGVQLSTLTPGWIFGA